MDVGQDHEARHKTVSGLHFLMMAATQLTMIGVSPWRLTVFRTDVVAWLPSYSPSTALPMSWSGPARFGEAGIEAELARKHRRRGSRHPSEMIEDVSA